MKVLAEVTWNLGGFRETPLVLQVVRLGIRFDLERTLRRRYLDAALKAAGRQVLYVGNVAYISGGFAERQRQELDQIDMAEDRGVLSTWGAKFRRGS